MSFSKAQDLMKLALMAAGRHQGVTLEEIVEEFGVSYRTAQRMTEALADVFKNVTYRDGEDRKRRWKIDNSGFNKLSARQDTELEALDIAIKAAHNDSRLRHARALGGVKELLLAGMTPREARRSEADAEAVLSSLGYIARPGPRAPIDPDILDCVTESLRGPFRLRIRYGDDNAMRLVEPHGLQLGPRSYLVARQKGRGEDFLSFRLDRIVEALCTDEAFDLDPQFSITEYSQRAFGAFHDPSQYGEVVWRFNPSAAKRALEFQFHPRQDLNFEEDGSLTVRFEAAGWLEMAWFLYQWGDSVEVLAPQALREFTYPYRRGDFPGLP